MKKLSISLFLLLIFLSIVQSDTLKVNPNKHFLIHQPVQWDSTTFQHHVCVFTLDSTHIVFDSTFFSGPGIFSLWMDDVNFDNNNELIIQEGCGAHGDNCIGYYYFYNDSLNRFIEDTIYRELGTNAQIDPEKKEIITGWNFYGGDNHYTTFKYVISENKPKLTETEEAYTDSSGNIRKKICKIDSSKNEMNCDSILIRNEQDEND